MEKTKTTEFKKTFELSTQIADSDTRKRIYEFLEEKVRNYNKINDPTTTKVLVLPSPTESNASFWSCVDNLSQTRTFGVKIILKDVNGSPCGNWGFMFNEDINGWVATSSVKPSLVNDGFSITGNDSKFLLNLMLKHCGVASKSKVAALKVFLEGRIAA